MILVVDDNKNIIQMVRKHLQILGHSAEFVMSGEEAIDKVAKNDYSLILLDLHLPGIDGFTTCQQIREAGKLFPIIALSADAIDRHQQEFKNAKMSDYLGKPYTIKQLKDMLDKWLRDGGGAQNPSC